MPSVKKVMKIADVVSQAYGEIEALGEELREAYDNTPENLQSSPIGEAREEAASSLESISEPDVPESLKEKELDIYVPERTQAAQRRLSRSDRRDDAVSLVNQVVDYLTNVSEDMKNSTSSESDIGDLVDGLGNFIEEAEAIDFPGRNV